ncbi:hypothetical protein P43SY_002299 [Pythium insidiosum]|uniref:PH domain-containing protein n=1 Tax=Pythium insidiosum TaxID=114742 RepID=A0AAD5MBA0_PYTIN|nr:hypothetical protein P43SY_002299 [Pythium insidiosum]
MACAGYLVVNAVQLVMAEMRHDGRLVCRGVDQSRLSKHRRRRHDDKLCDTSAALPELSRKMMHLHDSSSAVAWTARRCDPEPEEEPVPRDSMESDWALRSSISTTISSVDGAEEDAEPRVFQLSGFAVDVVDVDDNVARLPHSFYVRTRRVTIHADSSFTTSAPVDSIELSAPNEEAKQGWMTWLQKWRRIAIRSRKLETSDVRAYPRISAPVLPRHCTPIGVCVSAPD